jgi:glycosyltransferase involved in cell wall biosynthesis
MLKMDVICFGGEDWWYHNRGHIDMQLMRCLAKTGTVVYVNSIVMQKPSLKRNVGGGKSFTHKLIRKANSIFRGLQKSDAGFWVYSPASLPVHHIWWLRPVNKILLRLQLWIIMRKLEIRNPIVWVACPAACDVVIKMRKAKLVYQRTDRFEEYPNVDADVISSYDRKLKNTADLTLFVNCVLYEQEGRQCKKAIYLDHGVDYEGFAISEHNSYVLEDMADIPKPIVGFFGGIDDHTFDIGLIEKVVDLLPEMSFVFIGKASSDCSKLMSKKNVWMLGQKTYEQIPYYGMCFNVAIMPWRQNRWIEACNPIKLKEYLALGKPIVSTPFPELQKYRDVVYQATTLQEFADRIKQALVEDNSCRVITRRKKVEHASWDSKVRLVLEELFDSGGDFKNLTND